MKKKSLILQVLLIMVLFIILASCGKDDNQMSKYISKNELIELCNLTEEEYKDIDLDQFIEDFELEKENLEKYNIKELLKVYSSNSDYQYLFEKHSAGVKEDPYNEINVIAAFMNSGTSTKSVLIDFRDMKIYKSNNEYIFSNVSKYPSTDLSNQTLSEIVEELKTLGLFSWKSNRSDNVEITDWQKATIAIGYMDGTIMRVEYEGLISECAPDGFEELFDYFCEIK